MSRDRSHLRLVQGGPPQQVSRPDLRHQLRSDVVVYRVRVDLDRAAPAIWRRLDLRSDLPLDIVHQVLQVAFDWTDSHLHRFSLGGGPFDDGSQLFLCPYDVEDLDFDDDGLPAFAARLDETLSEPGDVLRYVYDYGDYWELTLRLEAILPGGSDCPTAEVVDGGRAAPPEDCGGLTDPDSLAEVLDDPAQFEPDAINTALRGPYFVMREAGIDRRLVDLMHRLRYTPMGAGLAERAQVLATEPTSLDDADLATYLGAHRWFLDRAKDGGIPLTSAGYLKPADVVEAAKVVPEMGDWIGAHNREVHSYPLLEFRESLQSMGLLRKYKGTLVLTKAGVAAQRDPSKLWDHLAARLSPDTDESFELQTTLVFLAYAGSCGDAELPFAEMADVLTDLGWRRSNGRTVQGYDLFHTPVHAALLNVADGPNTRTRRNRLSSGAATLARAALRR